MRGNVSSDGRSLLFLILIATERPMNATDLENITHLEKLILD